MSDDGNDKSTTTSEVTADALIQSAPTSSTETVPTAANSSVKMYWSLLSMAEP